MKTGFVRYVLTAFIAVCFCCGCESGGGGSSDGGSSEGSAILTGNIASFTGSSFAAASIMKSVAGTTVTIGGQSAVVDENGNFTITGIPAGSHTVTFAAGGSSATYSLNDLTEGETFVLENVRVAGTEVTTEHTGTWAGTITSSDLGLTLPFTMTINPNSNAFSATAGSGADKWSIVGTENGSSVRGTSTVTGGPCTGDTATISGTFSGSTVSGSYSAPGGKCNSSVGGVNATKQ